MGSVFQNRPHTSAELPSAGEPWAADRHAVRNTPRASRVRTRAPRRSSTTGCGAGSVATLPSRGYTPQVLLWAAFVVGAGLSFGADVQWEAPASCPNRATVVESLEHRLKGARGLVRVQGVLSRSDSGGFALSLTTEVDGRTAVRVLRANDCAVLTEAGVLVAAMTLDPIAVASSLKQSETVVAEEVVPVPPLTPAPRLPAPARTARTPVGPAEAEESAPTTPKLGPTLFRVSLEGGFDAGATSGLSAMGGLGLGLGWHALELEATAGVVAPRTVRTAEGAVRVDLIVGSVRAGVRLRPRWERMEVLVGVGLEAGAMRGRGLDVGAARSVPRPWVAPLMHAGARLWLLPWLAVRLRGEAAVAVERPAFILRGPGPPVTLYRPPAATPRVVLGLEFAPWSDAPRGNRRSR